MRRLILHIGIPKTGTSSLQSFFFHTRADLAKLGILYPGPDGAPAVSHANLVHFLSASRKQFDAAGLTVPPVRTHHQEPGGHRARLLGVLPAGSPESQICEAVARLAAEAGLKVDIIAFVQPQHLALNSSYSRRTKSLKNVLPFESFVHEKMMPPRFDYARSFACWTDRPHWTFIAVPFSAAAGTPDLKTTFFSRIGLAERARDLLQPAPRVKLNESPGPITGELRRRIATLLGSRQDATGAQREEMRRAVDTTAERNAWDKRRFNGIDNAFRDKARGFFLAPNEAFAQRFRSRAWHDVFRADYERDFVPNAITIEGSAREDLMTVQKAVPAAMAAAGLGGKAAPGRQAVRRS